MTPGDAPKLTIKDSKPLSFAHTAAVSALEALTTASSLKASWMTGSVSLVALAIAYGKAPEEYW